MGFSNMLPRSCFQVALLPTYQPTRCFNNVKGVVSFFLHIVSRFSSDFHVLLNTRSANYG